MRTFLFALIVAAAGCYSPGIQPCELACSANRACPDGLTCNGQNACAMTSTATCNELPIDAPTGDSADTRVTIEVRDQMGGPLAAALVVFADSAGAPVAEMPTGPDGKATVDLPAGGSATVIRTVLQKDGTGMDLHASTYLDLWPGARIISQAEIDRRTRTVRFQLPPPSTTSMFAIYTSCTAVVTSMATTAMTVEVEVPLRCAMFDVFVTANNSDGSTMFAAMLPAQTGPAVDVNVGSFKPLRGVSGTLTGLPGNTTNRVLNATPWATPGLPASSRALLTRQVDASGNPGAFLFPTDAGLQAELVLTLQPSPSTAPKVQVVNERIPASATTFNRDYNSTLLPWAGQPGFDVGSRRMSWSYVMPTATTPASPSFFAATITYGDDPNMGVIWRLVGDASRITTSGTTQSIAYPDIPGMRTFEPIATDVVADPVIVLFGVEPAAERDVRQILEPEGPDFGYFKIAALRHMTVSVGQ